MLSLFAIVCDNYISHTHEKKTAKMKYARLTGRLGSSSFNNTSWVNVISASCQPSPVVKPNLLDVLVWLES